MYCESDQAILCWDCDSRVHGANFLVAKHLRTLLCHLCQSPTPWTGSGPKLGPTVSVCETCVNRNGSREEINAGETRDGDEDDDEDDNYGDDVDDLEEEEDSSEEDDGGDSGDDEENQVVPLSSTMPPVSSSSTSEECSGGCGNGDTQGSGPRPRKVQPLKRMRGTVDPSSRVR
ncbi:hypothetical protein V6N13_078269 [Hibiscus sabdariffa]|uniref:B box-type domain-containing protein n=1 Tax=Hibiscus sabdariffa TaxID=183260 RepID=A0ABR2RN61_9ROSI